MLKMFRFSSSRVIEIAVIIFDVICICWNVSKVSLVEMSMREQEGEVLLESRMGYTGYHHGEAIEIFELG